MGAAITPDLLSIEDYLAGELVSNVKHEYVGGLVYALAGSRIVHNIIKGNIFGSLYGRLQASRCRPFDSDMKIRVRLPTHVCFYHPDVSVIFQSNPPHDSFQDRPAAIVEVPSRDTRRIDEWEKKDAYLTIPSLMAYLLVEQSIPAVTVYSRREQGFVREVFIGLEAVVPLPEFDTELPLTEIYDGVEFTPEKEEENF